ncbi:MAG: hypothetical protein L6R37_007722 [Teloschistes peruensis]|nr:MAG: hypothetical protein L6R37_007722 [Teloschistes peruensis]
MHYAAPSLALLATIAIGAPTDNPWKDAGVLDPWNEYGRPQKRQNNPWKDAGVLDPWDEYGVVQHLTEERSTNATGIISRTPLDADMLKALAKRIDYSKYIPGCSEADDPSYATNKPDWDINYGVLIPTEGKDGQCLDKTKNSMCWTDFLLTEAAFEYMSWTPSGGAINCDPTPGASCSSAEATLQQTCSTTGSTESNGYDWKVIDAAGKVSIDFKAFGFDLTAGLDVGGGYAKNFDKTTYNLNQVCVTASHLQQCNWPTNEGNNCHQVWYADRVLHVWGQAQRMCNKCSKGNVQQNTQIDMPYGKTCVRGQKEFDFFLPVNKLLHCGGKCNDPNPGIDIPPNGPRGAYQEPANWDALQLRTKEDP